MIWFIMVLTLLVTSHVAEAGQEDTTQRTTLIKVLMM